MSTLSLSSALFVVASTAGGAAVAWLGTSLHYRGKVSETRAQLEQAERAKQKAQELAVQSRQQVESLQQALSEAKRDGVIQNAASSARAEFLQDRKSTRLNSSHYSPSRMPSSA